MALKKRVLAAGSGIIVGIAFVTEYVLERVGYASTIFAFLPPRVRAAIMSEPYLIGFAALLFLAAVALLWSVAWSAAKATTNYRTSNEKAWEFSAKFEELSAKYDETLSFLNEIKQQQQQLTESIAEAIKKIGEFETGRRRMMGELQESASHAISAAARQAGERVENRLDEKRDHIKVELETQIGNLKTETEGRFERDIETVVRAVLEEERAKDASAQKE